MASDNTSSYTVPGLSQEDGDRVAALLQQRLHALNDLQLTLKHAHWNVVGPGFIGVHKMLDPQIEIVRAQVDVLAERVATLGGVPQGTPGSIVKDRMWDDYDLGRASTQEHLAALNVVYNGVVESHREAIEELGELDPVSEDILIGQAGELELFQWFMRAHLEDSSGALKSQGEDTEAGAAQAAKSGSKK